MPKTLKKKCCKKYRHKGKACSGCPFVARLDERESKSLLAEYKAAHKKAKKKKKKAKKRAKKKAKKAKEMQEK